MYTRTLVKVRICGKMRTRAQVTCTCGRTFIVAVDDTVCACGRHYNACGRPIRSDWRDEAVREGTY